MQNCAHTLYHYIFFQQCALMFPTIFQTHKKICYTEYSFKHSLWMHLRLLEGCISQYIIASHRLYIYYIYTIDPKNGSVTLQEGYISLYSQKQYKNVSVHSHQFLAWISISLYISISIQLRLRI